MTTREATEMETQVQQASDKWASERPKTPGLRGIGSKVADAVTAVVVARERGSEDAKAILEELIDLFDPAKTLMQAKVGISPVLALGDTIAEFEQAVLLKDYTQAIKLSIKIAWLARHCNLRRGDDGSTALLSMVAD